MRSYLQRVELIVAAVAASLDWSAGAQERRRSRQDALRVRQPGPRASVSAAGGADAGRLQHDAVSAAHQSAHASGSVAPRPSLGAHAGDTGFTVDYVQFSCLFNWTACLYGLLTRVGLWVVGL